MVIPVTVRIKHVEVQDPATVRRVVKLNQQVLFCNNRFEIHFELSRLRIIQNINSFLENQG